MTNPALPGILLIETNESDAKLTAEALETDHVGCRVVADHAGELSAWLEEFRKPERPASPCVIFLSFRVGDENDFDALRRIKSDSDTKRIPVVVITDQRDSDVIARAYDAGANSVVTRSLDASTFQDVVRRLAAYWIALNQTPHPRSNRLRGWTGLLGLQLGGWARVA